MKSTVSLISSTLLVIALATSTVAQVGPAPNDKGTPTPQEVEAIKHHQMEAIKRHQADVAIHHHVAGTHHRAAWEGHHKAAVQKKMEMENSEHEASLPAK